MEKIIAGSVIIICAIFFITLEIKFYKFRRKPNDADKNFTCTQLLLLIFTGVVFDAAIFYLVDVIGFDRDMELCAINSPERLFGSLICYVLIPLIFTIGIVKSFCRAKGIK